MASSIQPVTNTAGYFIGNFKKLGDVRKHWLREIQRGQVELVRELDQALDMSKLDAAIKSVDAYFCIKCVFAQI
jgi:hypothetical protein